MKLREMLKKIPVTTQKSALVLDKDFYLNVDSSGNLINGKEGVGERLNIGDFGVIVITPYAKGIYSDKFLNELAKTQIELCKLDWWGNPVWGFYPQGKTLATLIRAQLLYIEPANNIIRSRFIAELINEKAKNQNSLIKPELREKHKLTMLHITPFKSGDMAKWLDDTMLKEGGAAEKYWGAFAEQIDYDFSRATEKSPEHKKNVKATTEINALLNLGYGILAHKISFALFRSGLNPTVGLYHFVKAKGQRYSLTWDLIEPYRYLVDSVVMQHFEDIDTEDFDWITEDKKRYLTLKDTLHKVGEKIPRLKESPYKKWINIFVTELKTTDFAKQKWINLYKQELFNLLQTKDIGTPRQISNEEKERATGIKNVKNVLSQLTKRETKKIPKKLPVVTTDEVTVTEEEPIQESDRTLLKILKGKHEKRFAKTD